jgi:glycosyltransferase involved in cell wall biosynthesis
VTYSVIIPVYNGAKTIKRCLNSVLISFYNEDYEIIVVDDASQDDSSLIVKEMGIKVIQLEKNHGPSGARNMGARHANGEILFFIDSDVLLFKDAIQKINQFLKTKKKFVSVSCNFHPNCEMKDAISLYKHMYMCYSIIDHPDSVSWVFTSALAIKRKVFEQIGGFNEALRNNEDDFMGRELISRDYQLGFDRNIYIHHLHKYTFYSFFKEEFKRTRTLLVFKYTTIMRKVKMMKNNNAGNILLSILFFPFLVLSFVFIPFHFSIPLSALLIFYLLNTRFLFFCLKQKGINAMIKSAMIIPLDCTFCICGLLFGAIDILKGKRI